MVLPKVLSIFASSMSVFTVTGCLARCYGVHRCLPQSVSVWREYCIHANRASVLGLTSTHVVTRFGFWIYFKHLFVVGLSCISVRCQLWSLTIRLFSLYGQAFCVLTAVIQLIKNTVLTFAVVGLFSPPPCGFSRIVEKRRAQRRRFWHTCPYIYFSPSQKISAQGHLRSGHQVRSKDPTSKIFMITPWLQFLR